MEILHVFPLRTFDDDGYLLRSCLFDESLIGMIARADVCGGTSSEISANENKNINSCRNDSRDRTGKRGDPIDFFTSGR